jgi:hypothetical protein
MNEIEHLRNHLEQRLPAARFSISSPAVATGSWWLDARLHSAARGVGVSTPSCDDYVKGADEIYAGRDELFERVRRLLLSGGRTHGPEVLPLPNAS